MAFKEVSDLSTDTTVSLGGVNKKTGKPNPTKIEGYYLGKRTVDDKKKKTGKSYIYIFQTPKGNIGVWGKTDLDRKMNSATPGHMIRVTQSGMAQTPNGEMYKYKVEFDPENTIEVAGSQEESEKDDTQDTSNSSFASKWGQDENGFVDEVVDELEEELESAALLAAERKAKVEALLKSGKSKTGKN